MINLDDAMDQHIAYVVLSIGRPFCYRDFLRWDDGENKHEMTHGTFRNKVSKLVKSGEVELSYYSSCAFYTLKGHPFGKPMTPNPPVVSSSHPLYKTVRYLPFDKQSIHDIHATFKSTNIWQIFKSKYNFPRIATSEQIVIPSWKRNNTIVRTVISKTDTVPVTVGCSLEPIPLDFDGIIRFFSILADTHGLLVGLTLNNQNQYYNQTTCSDSAPDSIPLPLTAVRCSIPDYLSWIITMWHFGRDALIEYTGKELSITTENAQHIITRVYSKEWGKGTGRRKTRRLRHETQEYPNITVEDAIEEKLSSSSSSSELEEASIG